MAHAAGTLTSPTPAHSRAFRSSRPGLPRGITLAVGLLSWSLVGVPPAGTSLLASQQDGAAALALQVSLDGRAPEPGEVVLITVAGSRPLVGATAQLTAETPSRSVPLWPTDDPARWQGLFGIPLDTAPGRQTVSVRARSEGRPVVEAQSYLDVRTKEFATRRLTLDPRFVDPPADQIDRILEDAKIMADIFATSRPERLWHGPFERPVPGTSTSSFGRLTITNGEPGSRHQGTDFRAAEGTPILAPNAGEIVLVRNMYFAGNTVIVDHGWGLYSLFAHLSRTDVAVGQRVSRGDQLGAAGATGRVTGAHVHWAIRLGNTSVDSLSLVDAVAAPGAAQ